MTLIQLYLRVVSSIGMVMNVAFPFIFKRLPFALLLFVMVGFPAHAQISINTWGQGGVRVGTSTTTCDSNATGMMRWGAGSCMEFCNGTTWACITGACDAVATSFDFTDAPNSTTSTLISSNILSITGVDAACNSTVSVSGDGSPEFRVCSNAGCGSVVQNWTSANQSIAMNGRFLQVRATSASTNNVARNVTVNVGGTTNVWTVTTAVTGDCGATPTIGQVCSDGSVYAGITPDGNRPMYVARCDVGQTWSGSNCTGVRTMETWNDGAQNFTQTTALSMTSGTANTATLMLEDSNSVAPGVQPHDMAALCDSLSVHSKTDWYLPASDEIYTIYINLYDGVPQDGNPDPLIPGFSPSFYVSSRQWSYINYSDAINFADGLRGPRWKADTFPVRCARRG
jgi:hypothetical protein